MPYGNWPNGRCFTDNNLPPFLCAFPRGQEPASFPCHNPTYRSCSGLLLLVLRFDPVVSEPFTTLDQMWPVQ